MLTLLIAALIVSNFETNIQTEDTSGESSSIEVTETINHSNNKTPPIEQTYVKLADADHKLFETLQRDSMKKLKNTNYLITENS